MSVFHAYDIRGIYPDEVNEELFYKIGRRLPVFLGTYEFVIGRDARNSSVSLRESLIKGLLEAGADIIDVGVVSTPHLYFAQQFLGKEGAFMITASHNPKEYNGGKMLGKRGVPIGLAEGMGRLQDMLDEKEPANEKGSGSLITQSVQEEYIAFMTDSLETFPFRIVVDQSNSSAVAERKAIEKMADVVAEIDTTLDGNFPGHSPNPLDPQAQKIAEKVVLENKADMGMIFDGDCDRAVFIDEKGRAVPPDLMTAILAKTYTDGKVVYEVRSSKAVPESLTKRGLEPLLSKAGRTFMINEMIRTGAVMAGEKSGHYMFSECNNKECVGIAARKVMEVMLAEDKQLSELYDEMSAYCSMEEKNFHVGDVDETLAHIEAAFPDSEIKHIDGLSIYLDNGSWFNIRASNTEHGLLRLNGEANSQEELDALIEKISRILKE